MDKILLKPSGFLGTMAKKEVVILPDSGSSGSFISEMLATQLSGWSELAFPIKVRMANGRVMCTHEIQNCQVWICGNCFTVSLKVLPLQCYDLIL